MSRERPTTSWRAWATSACAAATLTSTWLACLATACSAIPSDAGGDSRQPPRGVLHQAASTCPASPATPLTGLIDDFDDRDLQLPPSSGFSGTWGTWTDSGTQLTPTIGPDPDDSGHQSLHVSKTAGFDGGHLDVNLSMGCPVDASEYTGVRLRARLNGSFRLNLATLDTTSTEVGGRCDSEDTSQVCSNHFGMPIRGMGARQEEYEIPFSRLSQAKLGPAGKFEPSELFGIDLLVEAGGPYEVWLDEIGFAVLDECSGSVTFEDELIDDFEDGDLVNRARPRGLAVAFKASINTATPSLCPDCLNVEPDPYGIRDQVARVAQAETLEVVMGSLAPGCRATDASGYDGVELKVHAEGQFTVVLVALDGESREQTFAGKAQWRTVRVAFGKELDRTRLDYLDIRQPFDTLFDRDDMLVDDLRFYREAPVGARCESDADCGGAVCFGPSSSVTAQGGPAGGVCSWPCTAAEDCSDLGAGSVCTTQLGYCAQTCDANGPLGVSLDPDKCRGRPDMVCVVDELALDTDGQAGAPGVAETTLCQPRCSSDAQCGGKLHCNPTTGLCQKAQPTGLAQGEPCEPEDAAPTTPCAGYCDPVSSTCRRPCVLAAPDGCASGSPDDSGALACLPLFGNSVPGNEGMCAVPCDCSDQCGRGEVCAAVTLAVPLAHAGVCAKEGSRVPTLANCPNGCASGEVRACRGRGDCLGSQYCEDDGSGYGACTCSDTTEPGGTSGEAGAPAEDAGPNGSGGEAGGAGAGVAGRPVVKTNTVRPLGLACGCSVPTRSRTGRGSALLLLLGFGLRRWSRVRRRSRLEPLPISLARVRPQGSKSSLSNGSLP